MTKWCTRNSRDIEVHCLHNRLQQQRHRTRNRDEKLRGFGKKNHVSNGFCLSKHDLNSLSLSIDIEDATRLTESAQDNIGKCDTEVDVLQETCILKQERTQQMEGHQCIVAATDPYITRTDYQPITSNTIQELLPELLPGCVNILQMDHDPAAKPLDPREQGRLLARRLKNRERQRRYRARKRLEADMNKTHFVHNTNSLKLELQPNGNTVNVVNSVYCRRKWKKDARRAPAPKEPDVTSTILQSSLVEFASEHLTQIPISEVTTEQPAELENLVVLNYGESNEDSHGRRDWKEDARSKVD